MYITVPSVITLCLLPTSNIKELFTWYTFNDSNDSNGAILPCMLASTNILNKNSISNLWIVMYESGSVFIFCVYMSLLVYVCMCLYIYMSMSLSVYVCQSVSLFVNMNACVLVCMYLCLHVYVCVYVCVHVCVFLCVYIAIWICICAFMCGHACYVYAYFCMYVSVCIFGSTVQVLPKFILSNY